jgi:hypothetical protein
MVARRLACVTIRKSAHLNVSGASIPRHSCAINIQDTSHPHLSDEISIHSGLTDQSDTIEKSFASKLCILAARRPCKAMSIPIDPRQWSPMKPIASLPVELCQPGIYAGVLIEFEAK